MKKYFTLTLLLFCVSFIFGETGYRDVEWYSEEKTVSKKIDLYPALSKEIEKKIELEDVGLKINNENKAILGEINQVSYFFSNEEAFYPKYTEGKKFRLIGVAYITSTENLQRLKNNFNKLVQKYIEARSDFKEIIENEFFKETDFNKLNNSTIDTLIKTVMATMSWDFERYGKNSPTFGNLAPDEDSTKKNGTLYIYDFNEDTRVYIYDNIIKDKAVVVYVPHEQDY